MQVNSNFTGTEISEQLARILSAPTFKGAPVLSSFLKFVVDETVGGREQEIKEYTIAIHVLSRKTDFNPQLDAIVRTHAGRLRRALKEYYYNAGKNDALLIEIPKGSYIPGFQSRHSVELSEEGKKARGHDNKTVVAVFPFRNISNDSSRDFFADGLCEQLSTELTRFQDLAIISYYSSRYVADKTKDVKEAAALLGADYLLTGSIQNDSKHLRISVQLILGDSGKQVWAKSFEKNNTASDLYEIQNEIVKNILTAIGGYYGAIFQDILNTARGSHAHKIETYDAIFCYYQYQRFFTKASFQQAITTLQAAVKADPNYALAWAMLGELYLDDKAMEFVKIENQMEEGLKYALRAVTIDPNCQHGYQALAWVYLFYHNREESLNAAYQCIAINPNSPDKVGAMGFGMICAGEFEHGYAFLKESIQHNPFCPWYFHLGFVLYFLYKKDYKEALHYAEKINMPEIEWTTMMRATVLGHLDRIQEAEKNLDLLVQQFPGIAGRAKDIFESFILTPDLNSEILEGLRKAGLYREREKVME